MPKHRRRSEDDSSVSDNDDDNNDDSSDDDSRRHKRRKSRHSKKTKKSRKHKTKDHRSKRRDRDDASSDGEDSEEAKRRKKHDKKRTKRERKGTSDEKRTPASTNVDSHSHILTQALCHLFSQRPVFAQELPILLIRLAGGATFDLRQMNDHVASTALERVLECLQDFGVQKKDGGWLFQAPSGRRDERVLLRIIRTQLDEVGVTIQAVAVHEKGLLEPTTISPPNEPTDGKSAALNRQDQVVDPVVDQVKDLTSTVVLKYQHKDSDLGRQLSGLCQAIAQGESIFIDGIPDGELKVALEEIFVVCGLEKSEMADEEGGGDSQPAMGYGMPEQSSDTIQLRLAAVMEACRNPKRRTLGPMRPTEQQVTMKYDSDDDEGPTLPGHEKRPRGPSLPAHVLKNQTEYRELELKAAVAGIEIPKNAGGREEWMIVPGKHDFLSTIKSGQPIKSRGFQNKKSRGDDDSPAPIHPAVQAEMDAIMQAHQDSRGPSLFDQHRAAKQEENKARAAIKQGWTWNRENDLDAGRRVDKDALHMVLGGATDNLKTKFRGGFD